MLEAWRYFFKTKSAYVVETGSLNQCNRSHSKCCCSRERDCSTSTHDLSTYVWHTEGDGVGITSSVRGDEDYCGSCRTGSCGQRGRSFPARSQSKGCEMTKGNACDASTSTVDLSTFVWGLDADVEDDDFAHDLGDRDNGGRSWEGGDRKRPRGDGFLELIARRNSSGLDAPRKKSRKD